MSWLICWAVAGAMQCGVTTYSTERVCKDAATGLQYCVRVL